MKHTLLTILAVLVTAGATTGQQPWNSRSGQPWKGTLRMLDGSTLSNCTVEKVVGSKLQVNHGGTLYGIPITSLTPASKGALGLGSPYEAQAYAEQQAVDAAARKAALAAEIDQHLAKAQALKEDRLAREAKAAKRESEMQRMREQAQREREIEAIEAVARALQQRQTKR